jgi:hypothetical protein
VSRRKRKKEETYKDKEKRKIEDVYCSVTMNCTNVA